MRHVVASIAVGLIATLLPSAASAQTILNVERLQPEDVLGWHTSVQGAFSAARGNSRYLDVTGGVVVGRRTPPHWLRLFTGMDYRSDDGDRSAHERFAHLRYGYEISRTWQTFHFVQAQRNHALLLRERTLVGSGIRRTLFRTERTLADLGTGAMYERELLDPDQAGADDDLDARVWRMANLGVVTHRFREGLRLIGVGYFQPDLADLGDYRALSDLSLLIALGPHVDLALRFEWRHDSRPPADLHSDDLLFETGVVVSLR
jgi:putative salt-induced outer membrane protein YdiY